MAKREKTGILIENNLHIAQGLHTIRAVLPSAFAQRLCPGGEIGRHKGFKIPRSKGRAGSSPAPGTIYTADFFPHFKPYHFVKVAKIASCSLCAESFFDSADYSLTLFRIIKSSITDTTNPAFTHSY
jgi:hypothetical protein